jgi:hypothetical protein
MSSETTLPDGGRKYNYNFDGEGTLSLPVPPASFDPTTASESELSSYGLPPRPPQTDLIAYGSWIATYSHLHWSSAPPFVANNTGLPSRAGLPPRITQTGPWAGFDAVTPDKANYFTSVSDTWTEPHINEASCGPNQDVGFWTGIGGLRGLGDWFGQNGTAYTPSVQNGHYAWYQVWGPTGSSPIVNASLNVGAIAHGDAVESASLWNPGEPWLSGSVTDYATHGSQGWVWTTSGIKSGHSAEVILESSLNAMGNFGTWAPDIASINNTHNFSDYPSSTSSDPYREQDVDQAGRAKTSLMNSNGSFTVTWTSCT